MLIITIILVAIIMLALGVKLLFNKDAEFTSHSCSIHESTNNEDEDSACSICQLKDIADCPEIKEN
ncbi:MAG: hypothetical protein AB7S69_10305 [Salinivirgaceae bacterium]